MTEPLTAVIDRPVRRDRREDSPRGTGASASSPPRWRFSLADYERLIETGILTEDDRVELIRGVVVEMSPIGARHVNCVNESSHLLNRRAGDDVIVQVQNPIALADGSEPQPDLALIRRGYDRRALPTVADILLVIEVADSSLSYDRTTKLPLYAAAGIPEAWIFDLTSDRIERHTDPGPNGYRQIALAGRGESLASTVVSAITLSIDAVVPAEQ